MLRAGIYDVSDKAKQAFLEHMEHKKEVRRASAELAEVNAQLEHTKKENKRIDAVCCESVSIAPVGPWKEEPRLA